MAKAEIIYHPVRQLKQTAIKWVYNIDHLKSVVVQANAISYFYIFYNQIKTADKSYFIQSYAGIYDQPELDISSIEAAINGNNAPFTLIVDNKSYNFSTYHHVPADNVSVSYLDDNIMK